MLTLRVTTTSYLQNVFKIYWQNCFARFVQKCLQYVNCLQILWHHIAASEHICKSDASTRTFQQLLRWPVCYAWQKHN